MGTVGVAVRVGVRVAVVEPEVGVGVADAEVLELAVGVAGMTLVIVRSYVGEALNPAVVVVTLNDT
jgi:hypothetical protein